MSTNSILLQGGTVLVHDEDDHVHPIKADLLIEGNIITKIEAGISHPSHAQIFDCTDKIITPGFVDTHHHVWQTLLKGRHANQLLLDYMPDGNFTSSLHSPADLFWGQLGGVLECLEAGTTTVVDHAHLNYSPEHTKAAIAATISSGIRSIFGYTPTPRVESWSPFAMSHDLLPDWVMSTLEQLAADGPFSEGRVQLGFAFDGFFLPKQVIVPLFEKVKSLGIKVITTHYCRNAISSSNSPVELLDSYGLLDSHILFSHATNATAIDAALLVKSNAHVSTTPSTDLQMALGENAAFHSEHTALQGQCGVGVDCHSNNSASIPSELRLLLQSARSAYNKKFTDQGNVPKTVNKTVEEAFNLGTVGGARAVGMEGKIGTLKVGAFADVVVWDALSPGMVCGAQHDPVAAIILHSSPSDIEVVIVDGVARKSGGKLKAVNVQDGRGLWDGEERDSLEWKDVAKELVGRREVLQAKVEKIDMAEARKGVIKGFYIDESRIVDAA